MKVQDVMTYDVHTCRPDSKLSMAAMQMWKGDFGILPVVQDGGKVVWSNYRSRYLHGGGDQASGPGNHSRGGSDQRTGLCMLARHRYRAGARKSCNDDRCGDYRS